MFCSIPGHIGIKCNEMVARASKADLGFRGGRGRLVFGIFRFSTLHIQTHPVPVAALLAQPDWK